MLQQFHDRAISNGHGSCSSIRPTMRRLTKRAPWCLRNQKRCLSSEHTPNLLLDSAVKIEYVCDRCEHGIYRHVSKKPITTNYIHKSQHRCTHCGDLADFAVPYLLIEVDGKPVSRVFIQREALPTPSGPGSQAFSVDQ